MSHLPAFHLPAPQLISMAFLLTDAAVADTDAQTRKALSSFAQTLADLRTAIGLAGQRADDLEFAVASAKPAEIRGYLDGLLEWESAAVQLGKSLRAMLSRKKFINLLRKPDMPLSYADIQTFCEELSSACIPIIRKMRVELISDVAKRAQQSGLEIISISDALRCTLLNASVEETMGWHETAYLLADVDEAKRLDRSIKDALTSSEIEPAEAH